MPASRTNAVKQLLSVSFYGVIALIGMLTFTYPFWLPALTHTQARQELAQAITMLVLVLSLLALLVDLQGQASSAKTVATLGILVSLV